MKTSFAALTLVVTAFGVQNAFGQIAVVPESANVTVAPTVGVGVPYAYGAVNPRLRGRGDLYRGLGEYNLYTSDGFINYEEARSRWLDNKLKAVMVYWERDRIGREHLAARAAQRRLVRDNWLKNRTPEIPARLTSAQYDPYDGRITWPAALMGAEFQDYREHLSNLFSIAADRRDGLLHQYEIKATVDEMKEILKEEILTMTPNQYIATRKFLDSLSWERQYQLPGASGFATTTRPQTKLASVNDERE